MITIHGNAEFSKEALEFFGLTKLQEDSDDHYEVAITDGLLPLNELKQDPNSTFLVYYYKNALEEENCNMQIYLDMDGCFSNFEGYFKTQHNIDPIKDSNKLWKSIYHLITSGREPFFEFEAFDYAKDFYFELQDFNPIFLSSTGNTKHEEIKEQKLKWLKATFGDVRSIIVKNSKEKAYYAANNAILLDDRDKPLQYFRDSGGQAIQFHSNNPVDVFFRLSLRGNRYESLIDFDKIKYCQRPN